MIQTCNLLIRSQMLYSVELRSPDCFHFRIASAKVEIYFHSTKYFLGKLLKSIKLMHSL